MHRAIPLIRAGSLAPLVKWMEARGRVVDVTLGLAGVACDPVSAPDQLVPMRAVSSLMRDIAEREVCPDLGWRVVSEFSLDDLGQFGQLALAQATPLAALRRASEGIRHFCSHESLDLVETPAGATVTIGFSIDLDPAALHQAHLFTLALVQSLGTRLGKPGQHFFSQVRIPPHPVAGLSHLPAALAAVTSVSADETLTMVIGRTLLHSPFKRRAALLVPVGQAGTLERLDEAGTGFAEVIGTLVVEALRTGQPSAQVMAKNAGVTLRTLQRRLAAEGTTFRDLVDAARRDLALEQIASGSDALGEVSDGLGYSNPASLSRAVQRWTDLSPRSLRRNLGG